MMRGGSLFAKYCGRGMSSSRNLSSEDPTRLLNPEPTRMSNFLFRSMLFLFGYTPAAYSYTAPHPEIAALRESLENKEKDLEYQMTRLEWEEALLAQLGQLSPLNKTEN